MASKNGYASQPSYMLYDTTGGTEDWSYYAPAAWGSPSRSARRTSTRPYSQTVAEYEGTRFGGWPGRQPGGVLHGDGEHRQPGATASLKGTRSPGAVLRLRKEFKTAPRRSSMREGNEGATILFDDTLSTVFDVPDSGRIEWGINPSTRPVAAQGKGRPITGSPSPAIERNGQPHHSRRARPTSTAPETCVAGGVKDEPFAVPANGGGVDNGFARVKLAFPEEADMDLEIYKADGAGNATGEPVASSAGGSNPEQTKIGPDPAPGNYVARVINYSGARPTTSTSPSSPRRRSFQPGPRGGRSPARPAADACSPAASC